MKEVEPNPWKIALEKYPVNSIVTGKVRNVTDFGIFVGLEEGIDGLVHISDLSWSQRQRKPSEFAKKGEDIEVKILNIDVEQERLSLGIKQLFPDPWQKLDDQVGLNSEVQGKIVNITDFGIFVEVLEGVEGLVHISEIDAAIARGKISDFYPLYSEVRVRVIKVDPEERRLGLSILDVIGVDTPVLSEASQESEVQEEASEESEVQKEASQESEVQEEASEESEVEAQEPTDETPSSE